MKKMLVLLVLLAANPVFAQGPIASYAMNDGADSSGNGHNATLVNTTPAEGRNGMALRFNGTTSRMTIPTFNLSGAFTIEAWVWLAVNTKTQVGTTGAVGWQAVIYKSNDNFFIAEAGGFYTAGFTTGTRIVQVVAPTKTLAGSWHHVAATYDGAALVMFIDGMEVARQAATGVLAASTQPVEIGGSSVDAGTTEGIIDDVRIYTRALNPAEITNDLSTGVDAVRDDVVSWDINTLSKYAGSTYVTVNYPKSTAVCNLATTTTPAMPVPNPTRLRLADPKVAGKECELFIQAQVMALPLGVGYTLQAMARGATSVSGPSIPSNPFDRVVLSSPPPVTDVLRALP